MRLVGTGSSGRGLIIAGDEIRALVDTHSTDDHVCIHDIGGARRVRRPVSAKLQGR